MDKCTACGNSFDYGSVEVASNLLGSVEELCIPCAAKRLGMTEQQVIALMDANDGDGTEMQADAELAIDIQFVGELPR